MEFEVSMGEREIKVAAWMLKTKSKANMAEFWKAVILEVVVLSVCIYNVFFYDNSTAAQKIILIILAVVCMVKAVLCKMKKINFVALAEKKNKHLKGKSYTCVFKDENVLCIGQKGTDTMEWSELTEWGEKNGCVYIIFKSGNTIILDEEKYDEQRMNDLKHLLDEKS